ncbi:MAG: N-acetylneuraminate epimerase [Planctomycetes bacterium]|nr:N-acetylneuraminate epimerase [Planctomycetota bacterium]
MSARALRAAVLASSVASSAVVASPAAVFAEGASWTSIVVKEKGPSLDQATVTGSIADAAGLADPVAVTVRLGEHAQTLPSGEFVRTPKKITWKAAAGATGVQSFTLTLKSGKFTVKAKGIEVGDLLEHVPFSIDVGGRSIATRHELSRKRGALEWKKGQPMRAVVTAQVFEVTHALGNVLLVPAAQLVFSGSAGSEVVRVIDADARVGSDGTLLAEVEFRDPSVLDALDMGAVFGTASGFTAPPLSRVTAGDDGESQAVVFLEKERGSARTIPPSGTTIDAPGTDGAPSGTLTVPAGAVASALPGVRFTPLALGASLPAPMPGGYVLIAGAELAADRDEEFAAANAPTMTLSRPAWIEPESLADADIRLLWWSGDAWEEQEGGGVHDAAADRIGPAPSAPARIPRTGFAAYAAAIGSGSADAKRKPPAAPPKRARGVVRDKDGFPLRNQVVLTRAGAMVTGADGAFEVPVSALTGDSLEVVQAIGTGASAATSVTREDAEVGIDVVAQSAQIEEYDLGLVSGTVYEPGGGTPVPGASVTLSVSSALRGLRLDDGGTPDDPLDDVLSVPDLSDLGVRSFRWDLSIPGDPADFRSAVTGSDITPALLLIEAVLAGRDPGAGAYTLRTSYDVPVLGEVSLYAGFRVKIDGSIPVLTSLQLPAAVAPAPLRTMTTDASGRFQSLVAAIDGLPMIAIAATASRSTAPEPFRFGTVATVDLAFPGGPPATPPGVAHGWNNVPPLPTPRFGARAAAIGGRIYVIGGSDSRDPLESYDPVSGAWATHATNPSQRDGSGYHAAYASSGGKLYAIGGYDPAIGGLASMDAYDPAANLWSPRAAMPQVRVGAAACTVGGRIHVHGGEGPPFLDSVLVYDPAADTWSAGPTMPTATYSGLGGGASSTGTGALVVGRLDRTSALHAHLLDTASALWTQLPPPPGNRAFDPAQPREAHGYRSSVTPLNGEHFVVTTEDYPWGVETAVWDPVAASWGSGPEYPAGNEVHGPAVAEFGGVVYLMGGAGPLSGQFSGTLCFAWRPAWVPQAPMPTARTGAGAAVLGGRVYVAGGDSGSQAVRTLEVYDVASDFWRTKAQMAAARRDHAVVAADGRIWAIGGFGAAPLASVEVYSPSEDAWSAGPPMGRARVGPAAAVVGGKIYVAGGGDASAEVFDPATGAWTDLAPMSMPRSRAAAAALNGKFFVAGGESGAETATAELFDPATGLWSPRASMATARSRFGLAEAGGRLHAIAGSSGAPTGSTEVYDPGVNAWTPGFPLSIARSGAAAVSLDGSIFVFGGRSASGAVLRGVAEYHVE